MKVLVTGAAGFIGSAVCQALVQRGDVVTGVDNLSPYYDVALKQARLARLQNLASDGGGRSRCGSGFSRDGAGEATTPPDDAKRGSGFSRDGAGEATTPSDGAECGSGFSRDGAGEATTPSDGAGHGSGFSRDGFVFHHLDLADRTAVEALFDEGDFDRVVHLAAQPGVRYSIDHPHTYIESNVVGFLNVLEGCRHHDAEHLVYASSSSVYGANERMPFRVGDNVDHPVSLYAASKKSNELMAHAYAHLYGLPATGLRFFTVYGPWGRPDMAPMLFTRAILAGEPIKVFNYGKHRRDFTYIDDIVEGVVRALDRPARPDPDWSGENPNPATSTAPWRLYNIGSNRPEELGRFIELLEAALGKEARKEFLPLQPGDVPDTYADVSTLVEDIGYRPGTTLEEGIAKFVAWYRDFYL